MKLKIVVAVSDDLAMLLAPVRPMQAFGTSYTLPGGRDDPQAT